MAQGVKVHVVQLRGLTPDALRYLRTKPRRTTALHCPDVVGKPMADPEGANVGYF